MKLLKCIFLFLCLLTLPACTGEAPSTAEEEACAAAMVYSDLVAEENMEKVLLRLSEKAYTAADIGGQYSFTNPEQIENFFEKDGEGAFELRFLRMCHDFGLIDTRIYQAEEGWSCKMLRIVWQEGRPQVSYSLEYPLTKLCLTEKGYLIFTCNIPDNTAASDHDGYIEPTTMLRLYALEESCIEAGKKFILPIGYNYNNLFTSSWNTEDTGELCLNDLFLSLYCMEYGSYISHFNNPYELVDGTPYTMVPAAEFKGITGKYLELPTELIREKAHYDDKKNCYLVTIDGVHDGLAKIPEAEVVRTERNEDGSLSLWVDALFYAYAKDKAFSHVVTVREREDGSFSYISNEVIYTDILPEHDCLFR